jgi:hypothetical protein
MTYFVSMCIVCALHALQNFFSSKGFASGRFDREVL